MSLQPLLSASPVIQIHAYAAIAAFIIGGIVLFRKKGTLGHKVLGRVWVLLMAIVALSSFLIWQIRLFGLFSPIHILSVVTLISLWQAIAFARARNITAHRSAMQVTYLGALVIAGFFTFMPGRIMHEVIFGPGNGTASQWTVFLIVFFGVLGLGGFAVRKRLGWKVPQLLGRRRI